MGLLGLTKMLAFLSLASLIALSQAAVLPAGLSAAACPNYPFCGPSPVEIPEVPGGAAILAAQKAVKHQHYIASIANPPVVPGLDVHAAALNAPCQDGCPRWTACPPGRPRKGPPAAAGDHRHPELFGLKTVTAKPAESKLYLKCAIITILGFNKIERRVQLKLEYCK